jgi:DNA polymerase III epsilon subunit-like protein
MKHLLIIDTETTGDGTSLYHDILEISAAYYHNGVRKEEFNMKYSHTNATQFQGGINYNKAVEHKKLKKKSADEGLSEFINWMEALTKKSPGKFYIIGYNVDWDFKHIRNWFKRNKITKKYFYDSPICVMQLVALRYDRFLKLPDACKRLGIKLNEKKLHTALYDRVITERLYHKLISKLKD